METGSSDNSTNDNKRNIDKEALVKKKEIQNDERNKQTIRYPTKLPIWSSQVQKLIEDKSILFKVRPFVNEASYFLKNLKEELSPGQPITKNEYAAFARTLCDNYAELLQITTSHDQKYVRPKYNVMRTC